MYNKDTVKESATQKSFAAFEVGYG